MLKLHGFAVSNYFNMVKLALLEKGVPFETVQVHASQTPEFLAISPGGKVPVLETEHGFINETCVILDYLEETQEGRALLPADAYNRARVRTLAREIELYIELPARSCYAEAFFGQPVPEVIKAKAKTDLLKGIATLARHGTFSPYVAGEQMTVADIFFLYSVDLAASVAKRLFDMDLLAALPQAKALLKLLEQNPHVQRIAADKVADMEVFMARMRGTR